MYYGCCFLLFLFNTKKYKMLIMYKTNILLHQCALIKFQNSLYRNNGFIVKMTEIPSKQL